MNFNVNITQRNTSLQNHHWKSKLNSLDVKITQVVSLFYFYYKSKITKVSRKLFKGVNQYYARNVLFSYSLMEF